MNFLPLTKIISGGQTGADQGGLAAGKVLGLETGGWMPRSFMTDAGIFTAHAEFGMLEHSSSEYPPRTKANVLESDCTLIFGDESSRGSRLTKNLCMQHRRPFFIVPWKTGTPCPFAWSLEIICGLREYNIRILNVAGNRERLMPHIAQACQVFLVDTLRDHIRVKTEYES